MKKLSVFIITLLLSISLFSQINNNDIREYFIDVLAENCNGYIKESFNYISQTDEFKGKMAYWSIIQPPEYYDFDLVRLSISIIINEYSDVEIIAYWRKSPSNDKEEYINCVLSINKNFITITYWVKQKYITTLYYV